MQLYEKYKSLFDKFGVNTPLRQAHFMAQIEHESGLKPISENLNYSYIGLLTTFHKYFKADIVVPYTANELKYYNKDSRAKASEYKKQPQRIANRVYANRMGNGNESSGEGWKYRGRGFVQITGKENYFRLANDTDLDCLQNPDLLLIEANAMISALWFWNLKGLNKFADKNDIIGITKKINGGLNGIEHRKELLQKHL